MSTGGPDLFVVCKNCGSEVSPYITECPYCGNRLRKRAPKIDREGRVTERQRRLRSPTPSLPRLKTGEIPGIRGDSRPYATLLLVVLGLVGSLLWRTGLFNDSVIQLVVVARPWSQQIWRIFTAPFVYDNTGFAFACIAAIGLYGWLLERRHGMLPVIVLFLLAGAGSMAVVAATAAIVKPEGVPMSVLLTRVPVRGGGAARDARRDLTAGGYDVLATEIEQNRARYADVWGTVPADLGSYGDLADELLKGEG